ncbi:MAG: type VI secretion system contractile sheath small subunit [Holosporales bacterium]|jgi:type VI secretion system protein ImpB|nr:type VI secretion system contractile sheath small subunit [Holosporales bacterium]
MTESTQHKLDRIRPPRVQITYDVEVGGAIEMKELPFVLGIMADLSGMLEEPLPKLKERRFVEIDRDSFNGVMASIGPRLALRVIDTLAKSGEGSEGSGGGEGSDGGEAEGAGPAETSIVLNFSNIDDFTPLNVAKKIPALAKLYDIRSHLKDLLTKLDGNDPLEALLKQLMTDSAAKDEVKAGLAAAKEGVEEATAQEGGEGAAAQADSQG